MAWFTLVLAGMLEVAWAAGLKGSGGLSPTKPVATASTLAAIVASMALLARSARSLPIGTAYAVWVGIGAVGTAVVGMLAFGEPASPARVGFLALIVAGIAGLKLTAT